MTVVLYYGKDDTWKVTDFGATAIGSASTARRTIYSRGTDSYRAPELLSENAKFTNKVDIWDLGCLLFELATSQKAFSEDWSIREYALSKLPLPIPPLPFDKRSNIAVAGLLHKLLLVNPSKRPTAAETFRNLEEIECGSIEDDEDVSWMSEADREYALLRRIRISAVIQICEVSLRSLCADISDMRHSYWHGILTIDFSRIN